MAEVFSKLKTNFGQRKNTKPIAKAKATPANKTVPTKRPTVKNIWIPGTIFILLLLTLLVSLALTTQQTRRNTSHMEILAHLQMHDQRLSRAAQQALMGQENAFQQLHDSLNQHRYLESILTQGGLYRNHQIEPITTPTVLPHLERYTQNWQQEDKKLTLILENQDLLIDLNRVINDINTASSQLFQLMNNLTDYLSQTGHSDNEIIAIETMKALAQSVTKSVNTIFPSGFPITEIKNQLTEDRKRFATIIQALNHGHNGFNLMSIDDKSALDILSQISSSFRHIDQQISVIQEHISRIITMKFAAKDVSTNSESILRLAKTLDETLQTHGHEHLTTLNKVTYATSILAILMLFLLISAIRKNTQNQLQSSQHEINKTQRAILRLLDDMKKIADGDLTARTIVTEDITGAIADSVNYTVEELQTLVAQVNKAGTQVVSASNKAQKLSTELHTAAQKQSLKIEETTIAVLGMTESISQVSDTATESAQVAKQSLATAEKGNIAVRESIAGMNEIRTHIQDTAKRIKRLGESSQEIGEIVALISDITEQTNVLALNAALQATAAGEAGRGFTVIAQEVQRLAERSAEATKQISGLVKTIQGDTQDTIAAMERSTVGVTKGASRSDAAGKALEEIEQVSKQLAQLVTSIFDTTHTQTQSANKVVANMEEILHITRQATNGTKQTALSIKQISGFASELKASVSSFKV